MAENEQSAPGSDRSAAINAIDEEIRHVDHQIRSVKVDRLYPLVIVKLNELKDLWREVRQRVVSGEMASDDALKFVDKHGESPSRPIPVPPWNGHFRDEPVMVRGEIMWYSSELSNGVYLVRDAQHLLRVVYAHECCWLR